LNRAGVGSLLAARSDPVIDFYPEIRLAHILAVIASGSLFLLRGVAVRVGRTDWALAPPLRYLSYTIDTALLAAALMLYAMLPSATFSNGWLVAKLVLLPLYIALGWLALRRAADGARQLVYFVGALLVFGLMFAIARTHDPLGPIQLLRGS
jgi:uncharacterized membrane protein SirB2